MVNSVFKSRITAPLAAALMLSACQTVSMPKLDLIKSPEFSADAANIGKDFPRVKDAPFEPTDIRSDEQWDKDAQTMMALRDGPHPLNPEAGLSEAEAEARYKALKAKVQAYKLDDPATGPVQGFPNYKPRR